MSGMVEDALTNERYTSATMVVIQAETSIDVKPLSATVSMNVPLLETVEPAIFTKTGLIEEDTVREEAIMEENPVIMEVMVVMAIMEEIPTIMEAVVVMIQAMGVEAETDVVVTEMVEIEVLITLG
jgi:hypothetical protein